MNAQQKLIEYANEIRAKSNTNLQDKSPEWIMGYAFAEGGICYRRDGGVRHSCLVERTGKTIVVKDIEIGETMKVIDGHGVFEPYETVTEVFQVEL